MKKTGYQWSLFLMINISDPKGWNSVKDFKSIKIDRNEFLNRAANSVIIPNSNISRREAAQTLRKLEKI